MQETGTLGVRVVPLLERFEADREIVEREISINGSKETVRLKKSSHNIKPEFEDVKRLCKKYKLPYRKVVQIIEESLLDVE
jgi:uncharacterized protein (DUF111 family)